MAGTVLLEGRLSVLLIVWRWTCSTHALCGGMSSTSLCAFLLVLTMLCCTMGIVCGLPVVGQNFLENGPPWGTGWCCCRRVLVAPFRPSFRSIEYIKCTLPDTPLQWTWLNESSWLSFTSWMLVICAPSPISLVLHPLPVRKSLSTSDKIEHLSCSARLVSGPRYVFDDCPLPIPSMVNAHIVACSDPTREKGLVNNDKILDHRSVKIMEYQSHSSLLYWIALVWERRFIHNYTTLPTKPWPDLFPSQGSGDEPSTLICMLQTVLFTVHLYTGCEPQNTPGDTPLHQAWSSHSYRPVNIIRISVRFQKCMFALNKPLYFSILAYF